MQAVLDWHVSNRIRKLILQEERAECGRSIISPLFKQLILEYKNRFNEKNLHRMVQFSEIFSDEQIVVSLTRQLSWTLFVILIPIQDNTKRDFYGEMFRIEKMEHKSFKIAKTLIILILVKKII